MEDQIDTIPYSQALEEAIETVHNCPCCGAPNIMVPGLICKHCEKEIDVKAFVYERRGVFYAECVTLNLMSRGNTQEEAIRRLQVAMFTYVGAVVSGGKSSAGLIPRRAPIASWARYFWHVLMARVSYLFGIKYHLATAVFSTALNEEKWIVHC
ncbi:MAG: hypothetical protein ABSD59_20215 [Terracidiphilus sp.]|jgi:predicted RNase H-like HicB family nuclease